MTRLLTRSKSHARKAAFGAAGVIGFLLLWQVISMLGIISEEHFPSATQTVAQLVTDATEMPSEDDTQVAALGQANASSGNLPPLWDDIRHTLTTWAIGLGIATLAGVVLGTLIGLIPVVRRGTHTTIEFLRPIPSVALIPLVVLLFGFTIESALVIVVYASFWQVLIQVMYGVVDVDAVARDTAKSYRLPRHTRFFKLVLPTALPYIMTGIRLAAAVALILAVTAEMLIGNPGLGETIVTARASGNSVRVFSTVIATGLLGLTINMVFRTIERKSLSWHQSQRVEEVL